METQETSADIKVAANRMLFSQCVFGLLFVLYECLVHDAVRVESALVGILIAVAPAFFGMYIASRKVKVKPETEIKELAKISRKVKLIYTVVLFALAFKLGEFNNVVLMSGYCITFFGYFLAPMINKPKLRTI